MNNIRKVIIVCIALFVGLLHFVIGPNYNGPFKNFMVGYLIDILLPFAVYFLFTLNSFLKNKTLLAVGVFMIGFSVETLQYFNIAIFGSTFDPYDYLMYGIGVITAVIADVLILSKLSKMYNNKVKN